MKLFCIFRWNLLGVIFCPMPPVLLVGTTEHSLAPSSWHPHYTFTPQTLNSLVYKGGDVAVIKLKDMPKKDIIFVSWHVDVFLDLTVI